MADKVKNGPVLKGSCTCGGIQFEIRGPVVGINQCHCDKCRKETGTGSSTFLRGFRREADCAREMPTAHSARRI